MPVHFKRKRREKKDIKSNKDELKGVKKRCDEVAKETNTLKASNLKLESKMVDLESRSMREYLIFYGIAEGGEDENCKGLVYRVCRGVLKVTIADKMLFDRAHGLEGNTGLKCVL